MDFDIEPFCGVGPLLFGLSRPQVRAILGPCTIFNQSAADSQPSDDHAVLGLRLFYDADARLEAVEAFRPANPSFLGIVLMGVPISDLRASFQQLDPTLEDEPAGFLCPSFGIAISTDDRSRPPTADGVFVYRRGYFGG